MRKISKSCYDNYCKILQEELMPATGCTEPIAIAYASARARQVLGKLPNKCVIEVSGNIIKNTKSVVVPNTGGLRGIQAALSAGVVVGQPDKALDVLRDVSARDKEKIVDFMHSTDITVIPSKSGILFYIAVSLYSGEDCARVIVENYHTNVVSIECNDVKIFGEGKDCNHGIAVCQTDRNHMTIESIIDFASEVDIEDVYRPISRQIEYNSLISEEGLRCDYGACVGKVLLATRENSIINRAKASAAAGSDARMSGCELPVIIVSGSGNQGMTASLPVIEYAKHLNCTQEQLIRALVVSDLVTVEQKSGIGSLSAFCGAVSAGCGAAAGIAYLSGYGFDIIASTITNTLAIISGMICDGAKPSCAAKIAASVDAGLTGFAQALANKNFSSGDGIVCQCVDMTIGNISEIARDGMKQTDQKILEIMTKK